MATAVHLSLSTIPQEVAEHILKFCQARDYANISRTCRALHKVVYNEDDQCVWREGFLSYPFDDLRKSFEYSPDTAIDWRGELQNRVFAERVLQSTHVPVMVDEANIEEADRVLSALETVLKAIQSASPGELSETEESSSTLSWAENVLLKSGIFEAALTLEPSREDHAAVDTISYKLRQIRAQLRSYLTINFERGGTEESDKRLRHTRSFSRCFVYDLRNYQDETLWGPYEAIPDAYDPTKPDDIYVDWEHVEHIQNVVFMNLRELPPLLQKPAIPTFNIQMTRPYSAPRSSERKPHDWAGVEGVWRRVVCFMDYRDLFSFNFTTIASMRRKPAYFDEEFAEAVRVIEIQLELDGDVELASEHGDDPDPAYPPLAFRGTSRGVHLNRKSQVTGTIRKKHGYVRWTFITTHMGDASRWSAEGVQVGGICSAMGIAGIWTVAVHEDHGDPAGPFWMWKASESIPEGLLPIEA